MKEITSKHFVHQANRVEKDFASDKVLYASELGGGRAVDVSYTVEDVKYTPLYVYFDIRTEWREYCVWIVYRVEYGVEEFTFRCANTGESCVGERFKRLSPRLGEQVSLHLSSQEAEESAKTAKADQELEVIIEKMECPREVHFSFEFPSGETSIVASSSWVLYKEENFKVILTSENIVNPNQYPGIAYICRGSDRVGMSSSLYTYWSKVTHRPGLKLEKVSDFNKKLNNFLAPAGERITFDNSYTWGSREDSRWCLVVDGTIWKHEDGHLGVAIINSKNEGSGRKAYKSYELVIPLKAVWHVKKVADAITDGHDDSSTENATETNSLGDFFGGALSGLKFE